MAYLKSKFLISNSNVFTRCFITMHYLLGMINNWWCLGDVDGIYSVCRGFTDGDWHMCPADSAVLTQWPSIVLLNTRFSLIHRVLKRTWLRTNKLAQCFNYIMRLWNYMSTMIFDCNTFHFRNQLRTIIKIIQIYFQFLYVDLAFYVNTYF